MLMKNFTKLFFVLAVVLASTVWAAAVTPPAYQPIPADATKILASGLADLSGSGGIASVEYWIWDGGNGYYYYTYQVHNTTFSPFIKHLLVGNPTGEPYYVTGSSGGGAVGGTPWAYSGHDTRPKEVHWMAVSSATLIYPGQSSWDAPLFQFASALPPASAPVTLHEGDVSVYAQGLIAAPGRATTPRSQGYWKHQFGTKGQRAEADSLGTYMTAIKAVSDVFGPVLTGMEPIDKPYGASILSVDDNSDMLSKAKMQLFALWLNVVSGKLAGTVTFEDPLGQTVTTTVEQVIADIESKINNPAATQDELEYVKDVAEILNCS